MILTVAFYMNMRYAFIIYAYSCIYA